jgi:hypothetical protein
MMIKPATKTALLAVLLGASFSLASVCFGQVAASATPKPAATKNAASKSKSKTGTSTKTPATVKPATPGAPPTTPLPEAAGKRDPFEPLINQHKDAGAGIHLPPGKAGLVVATVRVDGAVHSQGGMIAIVSNPEQHVYFIREGDRLYDGDVEKIGLDGVTFRETSKDAFGKPIERVVTKRIYASAGE